MVNPYSKESTGGGWFWHDETGEEYGPYRTYWAAKLALDRYCDYFLEGKPVPFWLRIWPRIKRVLGML